MTQVKEGDTVKIHFTGRLEDGMIFEHSKDGGPLELEIGKGGIKGLEKGIIGMEVGEKKTISVPPGEGFGLRREDAMLAVKKGDLPGEFSPTIGHQVEVKGPDGELYDAIIADINGDVITLDVNHPLAGRTLIFDVDLLEIL